MKITADFLEDKLRALTVAQLADRLDISADTLQGKIKTLGVDVRQLKHDYALEVLGALSGKMTFSQMVKETGFCRRKILNYAANHGIKSSGRLKK